MSLLPRLLGMVAALTVLSLVACSSRVHHPRAAGDAAPAFIRVSLPSPEFSYRKGPTFLVHGREEVSRDYVVEPHSMQSAGENGQDGNLVTASYFRSKRPGRRPLIVILPIWGTSELPSNLFAEHAREDSVGAVHVLQIHGPNMLLDVYGLAHAPTERDFALLMERSAERIVNTVIDVRRIVDWAETRPEIDRDRIAIVGFSIGAVVASLALANEPRLRAGVLVMGGALLHDMIAVCDGTPGAMRKLVTGRFGWSVARFREEIRAPLARIDPLRYAGRVDPRGVLIVEAGGDTCVTPAGRQRFWEAMGRPERIVYGYDHTASFFAMTFLGGGVLQEEAFGFLERVLGFAAGQGNGS